MKRILSLAIVGLMAVACSSTDVMVRPGAKAPNMAEDKFILMPVDIHGLPGDATAQGAALFGGFMGAFKGNGISLQPLKPVFEEVGLGNVSWELAEGMYHLVSAHGKYDFGEDAGFHGGDSKLQALVEGTAKIIGLAAEKLGLDFKPKYVAVAHIDSASSRVPKTVGYRVIVGVYNVEESKIDRVTWYEKTTADDEAAILAEMGTLGSEAYRKLFGGEDAGGESGSEDDGSGGSDGTDDASTDGGDSAADASGDDGSASDGGDDTGDGGDDAGDGAVADGADDSAEVPEDPAPEEPVDDTSAENEAVAAARALLEEGKKKPAIAAFESCLKDDPEECGCRRGLADAHAHKAKKKAMKKACKLYEQYVQQCAAAEDVDEVFALVEEKCSKKKGKKKRKKR